MEMIGYAILIGLIPASIAFSKGRRFFPWWGFGALLFFVALPMALLIKPDQEALIRRRALRNWRGIGAAALLPITETGEAGLSLADGAPKPKAKLQSSFISEMTTAWEHARAPRKAVIILLSAVSSIGTLAFLDLRLPIRDGAITTAAADPVQDLGSAAPTVENARRLERAQQEKYDAKRGTRLLVGTHMITTKPYAGCRAVEDLETFRTLINEGDQQAAMALERQTNCIIVPVNTKAIVQDESVWHHATCMRTRGNPFCFWIPTDIIEQSD